MPYMKMHINYNTSTKRVSTAGFHKHCTVYA